MMRRTLVLLVLLWPAHVLAQTTSVVEGTVVKVEPRWETNDFGDELIVSRLTLDPLVVVRGRQPDAVDVVGGTLDGVTLELAHQLTPQVGDDVILFINQHAVLRVFRPAETATFVVNAHTWRPSAVPVPYYIDARNADVSQSAAITALRQGAAVWGLQSQARFDWLYAGQITGGRVAKNFRNEVFFRNEDRGGVIAATYWWYDGSGFLIDSDIVFYDGGWVFFTGTSGCNRGAFIEDVAAHEFGHALGLRHSDTTSATMFRKYRRCSTSFRTLDADDVAGVEFQYPPG